MRAPARRVVLVPSFLVVASVAAAVVAGTLGAPAHAKEPVASAKAARAPKPPVPLEEYFKIRRFGSRSGVLLSFSHDEKLVAYLSDEGGRTDIWVQPVAGGPARQITHVKGFIQGMAFSPTADQLVFATDIGGDELPHLFLTDSKGTAPRDITANHPAGRRADFVEWADDGKTFLFLSSLRDEKYEDVCEYDVASGKVERLWEGSGKLAFEGVSRNHRRFIIRETLSDANSNLYLVERGAKTAPVLLTPHKGDVLFGAQDLARDAKTLYYVSDESGEFLSLYAMDLQHHTSKAVVQKKWDVDAAGFTHAFKYMFVAVNNDGQFDLMVKEADGGKPVALPPPPPGGAWVPLVSSRTDRYLGVRLQSDAAPATPYVIDMQSHTARKVIEPLPPTLRDRKMIVGDVVHIPSFDGQPVSAFLYKPEGNGPFPAVIDVHGGPTAQSRREFSNIRQYLLSKGYVVLVPNVRGSTGYGKSFTRLDNHDLGGGPLKDVVACKKWLIAQAHVDPAKVVVMGGSYGGYMALAAATFTPNEFAALVDYFGVSDLKTLVESFPPYWASASSFIYQKFGNPKDPADAKYQHDRSPVHFADRIVKPLLVVQGDRDARVKKDQSDRIVAELKRRKVPVHYLILADEGHGFSKTENLLAAFAATDRFLDRYLFGDHSIEVVKEAKR
jgi:dipeptidyl aminopeptidase/acylaminoacyl peptidase